MNLIEYLNEAMNNKFNPEKAKTVVDIEKAINNGDFIVTGDIEFRCKHLDEVSCEDLEEAIKQYWDDAGIDWMKLERKGNMFKIHSVASK